MAKKVLILVFSNLKKDARVARQIDFLKSEYKVTVACFDADPDGFAFIPLQQIKLSFYRKLTVGLFLIVQQFKKALHLLYPYAETKTKIGTEHFDLIIANDVETLMLAFDLAKPGTKVIFDAHEYAPRHFEDKLIWKLLFQPMNVFICKMFIPKVDGMMTIGKGLATEYKKNFKVTATIITNAGHYIPLTPTPTNPSSIRLVHHGIATPSRKLELMIEMMTYLDDRFTLDMYLLSEGFSAKRTIQYPEYLKSLASKTNRVRILPPIKRELIVTTLNEYDMGVFLIPPVNFNYANTLPNKLFDFIQARIAIAIGPTPEMAEIVNNYKIGVVSDDFSPQGLAKKIVQLSAQDLTALKENTQKAAMELSAEQNKVKLLELVNRVLNA